ncbi:ribonuclease P protein subunit [Candidatus Woesearchaeota archaeon]|nr:ribonuclease P protein subunit [Candidatus Woesearchaeota archaeon]
MDISEIVKHELIGINIKVIDSKNKSDIGIEGTIIDETKSTLNIETASGKRKVLFKSNIIIETVINNKKVQIKGSGLLGRPQDRIKS